MLPRRHWMLLVALAIAGCHHASTDATCDVPDRVGLEAKGRSDGIYGVIGDEVEKTPLQHFEDLTLTSQGVDTESGKRWLRLHASGDDAHALADFTARTEGRSLAVVIGGEVACHHKIRAPVAGDDFQVSCCNPTACDRWIDKLAK